MNYFYCSDASKKEQLVVWLSTLDRSHMKAESPKALQRQKLLSKNSMHDCSCLSILLATEHGIQEELLSFQTPLGSQHKPISFLVFPA